jgi:hypothetical protein
MVMNRGVLIDVLFTRTARIMSSIPWCLLHAWVSCRAVGLSLARFYIYDLGKREYVCSGRESNQASEHEAV